MLILPLLFSTASFAQTTDTDIGVISVVQKLFDGMAAHDRAAMSATLLPEARFYSARGDATTTVTASDEFLTHVAGIKQPLLERFTAPPHITREGRIAHLWAPYEFLLDGKFHHCGIDSVDLLLGSDGWKIASIVYTSVTTGCKSQ